MGGEALTPSRGGLGRPVRVTVRFMTRDSVRVRDSVQSRVRVSVRVRVSGFGFRVEEAGCPLHITARRQATKATAKDKAKPHS